MTTAIRRLFHSSWWVRCAVVISMESRWNPSSLPRNQSSTWYSMTTSWTRRNPATLVTYCETVLCTLGTWADRPFCDDITFEWYPFGACLRTHFSFVTNDPSYPYVQFKFEKWGERKTTSTESFLSVLLTRSAVNERKTTIEKQRRHLTPSWCAV